MTHAPRETFYVALPPQPPEPQAAPRPVARLLGEEDDAALRRLTRPAFQLLRRFARRDNAEGLRNQLHALGVEAFIVSDAEARRRLFLWTADASVGAGGVAVRDFSGQPLFTPYENLASVALGVADLVDGSQTTLVDIHLRTGDVTPRIDTRVFDFTRTMKHEDADLEDLLEELDAAAGVVIDRRYDAARPLAAELPQGLATLPGRFPPPAEKLEAPYDEASLRMFDAWSFLALEWERQRPQPDAEA